jgi:hypothetical protein
MATQPARTRGICRAARWVPSAQGRTWHPPEVDSETWVAAQFDDIAAKRAADAG